MLDQKYEEIRQTIHDSDDKIREAKKTIEDTKAESIEAVQAKSVSSQNEITKATEDNIEEINTLTKAFKELAATAYNHKSSDLIGDEYRKNAESHQTRETLFQKVGACSILAAIGVLIIWVALVIFGWISTETEYHWLPVATITSLFIFLSRWSARIAYRHGLEARRLNQFALDLTAMPAFFAQELLDQGDLQFRIEGKKIIQAKASKMFGNIERFDEQHSHSAMELIWKWVTKKSETFADNDINSPEEGTPKAKPTAKKKRAPVPDDEQ